MSSHLPDRPDLEFLRREAKSLLKAVRAHEAAALTRIARVPRLATLAPAALPDRAQLADAQHALALEYGFESWPRLKQEVESRAPLAEQAERFLLALREGNDSRAARLAERVPALSRANLSCAAALANASEVERLLAADAALVHEQRGPAEWRPLLYACVATALPHDDAQRDALTRVVERLIAAGAEPNRCVRWAPDDEHSPLLSPLYFASNTGAARIVRALLAAGARPNDGESVYHAAERDQRECLGLLLAHGADLDEATPPYGVTPLFFLLGHRDGQPGTVAADRGLAWLLEHGARPDSPSGVKRETALHAAARSGRRAEIIAQLVAHGGTVDAARADGTTPLGLALRSGHAATAAALRAHGAREDLVRNADRLLAACVAGRFEDAKQIAAQEPAALEEAMPDLMEGLGHVAASGRIEVLAVLLGFGVPVTAPGVHGATAMHWAAWHGNAQTVEWLLAQGSPVDARDKTYGSSPLAWACHGSRFNHVPKARYLPIVDALIAAGSDRATSINRWNDGPEKFANRELLEKLRVAGLVPDAEYAAALERLEEEEAEAAR